MTETPTRTEMRKFLQSTRPDLFRLSPKSIYTNAFLWKSRRPELNATMIPQQWTPPCGNQCTHKYAALMQIPWRVFCKKGCNADGDTWEECLSECDEICYKDPVLKDQQWSAYIDRSPGSASYSQDCFHACVSGCGYKFDIPSEKVTEIHPNRPSPPPPIPAATKSDPAVDKSTIIKEDIPCTSA